MTVSAANMFEAFVARFGQFEGTVYQPMLPPFIDPIRWVGYRKKARRWPTGTW